MENNAGKVKIPYDIKESRFITTSTGGPKKEKKFTESPPKKKKTYYSSYIPVSMAVYNTRKRSIFGER